MKEPTWIDAKTACARLGIKPQTLYAYVSRHRIRVKADARDARASLYALADIDTLVHKAHRSRARHDIAQSAIRWGDAIMPTSISEVRDGTVWLRGRAIEDCAQAMSLEQAMAWLCGIPDVACASNTTARAPEGSTFTRAMRVLAHETGSVPPMQDLEAGDIAQDAGRMLSLVTDACLGTSLGGPVHARIASVWRAPPHARDPIRRALVLLSDHELNPSTFAVRICASTGTSLPAALLAGMATLSGPRHGGVAQQTLASMRAALEGRLERFWDARPGKDPYVFGFGHPLYPEGDPRARDLLRVVPRDAPVAQAVRRLSAFHDKPPNIDAALAAVTIHFGLPADAPMTLFAVGRTTGWIAHAIEQVESSAPIRPRARYRATPSADQS